MIICGVCGGRNEDDESFCGECGAYLEFEGEREASAVVEVPQVVAAEPVVHGPSLLERVKTAVGIGEDEQTPAPADADSPAAPAAAVDAIPAGKHGTPVPETRASLNQFSTPPPAPPPEAKSRHAAAESATAPSPVATPEPTRIPKAQPGIAKPAVPTQAAQPPSGPSAVKPREVTRPIAPPRKKLPPEDRKPLPGELICGNCGAGNAPTRKFCRRCGTDLVDAPVVKLHWWQRVRKPKQGPQAGYPKKVKRRRFGWLRGGAWRLGGIAGIIILVLWFREPIWGFGQTALDRFKGTDTIDPSGTSASSSAAGHTPNLIRDGAPNRYWAPSGRPGGVGEWVQADFSAPHRLVYVRIFAGSSADNLSKFKETARPSKLTVVVTNSSGKTKVKHIQLSDDPGEQRFTIGASDAQHVRFTIDSSVGGTGLPVAIGEIEFLVRK